MSQTEQRREESAISNNGNQLVVSYLILRRAVGILGVLLPVILVIGAVDKGLH